MTSTLISSLLLVPMLLALVLMESRDYAMEGRQMSAYLLTKTEALPGSWKLGFDILVLTSASCPRTAMPLVTTTWGTPGLFRAWVMIMILALLDMPMAGV